MDRGADWLAREARNPEAISTLATLMLAVPVLDLPAGAALVLEATAGASGAVAGIGAVRHHQYASAAIDFAAVPFALEGSALAVTRADLER